MWEGNSLPVQVSTVPPASLVVLFLFTLTPCLFLFLSH